MSRMRTIRTTTARLAAAVMQTVGLAPTLFTSPAPAGAAPIVIQPPSRPQGPTLTRRNVLLIILDDVGADQIQAYIDHYAGTSSTTDNIVNSMTPCTSTISALAASGVMFTQAWGCPTCSPSRASMLTGTHPFRHKVYKPEDEEFFTDAGTPATTADDPTTIATVLGDSAAGYANGLFGKWHLGQDSDHRPQDHGWDVHQGYLGGAVADYNHWKRYDGDTWAWCDDYSTKRIASDAVAWIEAQTTPWMATVAFNAAHRALGETYVGQEPPSDCVCTSVPDGGTDQEIYRGIVECLDHYIGELLAGIPSQMLDKTTIILIGDNGTEDTISEQFGTDNGKGTLYEGGLNVPLIIAEGACYRTGMPAVIPFLSSTGQVVNPGRKSSAMVQGVDLFATIADIAGADKSTGVDSYSLIPILNNTAASVRPYAFAQLTDDHWAVRSTNYKLIVEFEGTADEALELYHISQDRWELNDLITAGAYGAGVAVTDLKNRKAATGCP